MRIALAAPLGYGLFLLGTLERELVADRAMLSLTVGAGVLLLGLATGCVLLFVAPDARWTWLAVAAAGLYILFVWYFAIHLGFLGEVRGTNWRPGREAAVGAYAVVLASAVFVKRSRKGSHVPRSPISEHRRI